MLRRRPTRGGPAALLAPAFLSALLSLCFPSPSLRAQEGGTGSIAGRIVPAHDHDFVLATALIPDLSLKVVVAADGSFRFEDLRPGTYLVEVRVPSLGVAVEPVEVRPGEEVAVELVLRPGSHSDEIVVTAAAGAREPLELAAPTTSLSGQELDLALESSLGETLAGEPGISSTFFGPGASRPVIRGFTGDRVRMLEGGIGTGDASGVSADHAVTADPAQADRIEVIRGPATLLYGSSAVGGVVNVIDERIPTSRGAGGVHGTASLRGGTVSDQRMGSLEVSGGGGDWAWSAEGTVRESDDYRVPGRVRRISEEGGEPPEGSPFGRVPNTDVESRGGRVGGSYFFAGRGYLGVSVSGFESEYGLPGGLGHGEPDEDGEDHGEAAHEEEAVRIDLEQRRFDLRGEWTTPSGPFQAFKVRAGATDYQHVELEDGEEGTLFFNDFFETRFELVQRPRGRHGGSVGAQFFARDLEAEGEEAFIPPTETERWALFSLQELESGRLRWQAGARWESQGIDASAAPGGPSGGRLSRSHQGLSASLGLVWEVSDAFTLAASAARSVKLPAPEELFSTGLHVASQAFEVGDPDLVEEVGLGLDLSLRRTAGRATGELTLFRQDFDEFIFQAFTGEEDEGFPVVLYTQRDARFTGAEVKVRLELFERRGHHLHLRLVGDLVDAELEGEGGNLPRIPPLRLGAGLHYHSELWSAAGEVRWIDDQEEVAERETPTDGYTLLNASVGRRFLFRNQIVDLLLRGRNLTDEEARSHTSFLKDVAPLPGRDVTLTVKLLF